MREKLFYIYRLQFSSEKPEIGYLYCLPFDTKQQYNLYIKERNDRGFRCITIPTSCVRKIIGTVETNRLINGIITSVKWPLPLPSK